jgi:hypothetical protein
VFEDACDLLEWHAGGGQQAGRWRRSKSTEPARTRSGRRWGSGRQRQPELAPRRRGLGGPELDPSTDPHDGLPDAQQLSLEVDVLPPQRQQLPRSQAAGEGDDDCCLDGMALGCGKQGVTHVGARIGGSGLELALEKRPDYLAGASRRAHRPTPGAVPSVGVSLGVGRRRLAAMSAAD